MIFCKNAFAKALDSAVFPGLQGGPLMHVIAAKAVAFKEALTPEFKSYQRQIVANCRALADELLARGFTLVTGGTDNHLLLIDLRDKNLTGKEAEGMLAKTGISLNKNIIPFDPHGPAVTSGIRLGTPALTTRGMKEEEMRTIARLVAEVLVHREDQKTQQRVEEEVRSLCRKFPIFPSFRD